MISSSQMFVVCRVLSNTSRPVALMSVLPCSRRGSGRGTRCAVGSSNAFNVVCSSIRWNRLKVPAKLSPTFGLSRSDDRVLAGLEPLASLRGFDQSDGTRAATAAGAGLQPRDPACLRHRTEPRTEPRTTVGRHPKHERDGP